MVPASDEFNTMGKSLALWTAGDEFNTMGKGLVLQMEKEMSTMLRRCVARVSHADAMRGLEKRDIRLWSAEGRVLRSWAVVSPRGRRSCREADSH